VRKEERSKTIRGEMYNIGVVNRPTSHPGGREEKISAAVIWGKKYEKGEGKRGENFKNKAREKIK
jgi:hypothetical protein